MAGERTAALADVDADSVPYFVVAAAAEPRSTRSRPDRGADARPGEVVVVGTGPAGPRLADAAEPPAPSPPPTTWSATPPTWTGCRPTRASAGTPPTTRSSPSAPSSRSTWRGRGRRVAVVSCGDPGVFAMATAVLEVATQDAYADVAGAGAARGDRGQRGRRAGPAPRWATTTP